MIALARRLSSLAVIALTVPACVIGELPAPIDETGVAGGGGTAGKAGAGQGGASAGSGGGTSGTGGQGGSGGSAGEGGSGGASGASAGKGGSGGAGQSGAAGDAGASGESGAAGGSGEAGEGGAGGGGVGEAGKAGASGSSAGSAGAGGIVQGGAAGAAGSGGDAGAAGSDAGQSGAAGTAGQGGTGTGGQGGDAGQSGASGQAGTAGMAGTAGAAGTAGQAGAGGTAGASGSAGTGGSGGSGGGGPVSECLPSIVKDLVHWWPLDRDTGGTGSPFQGPAPERLVPDIMGRRYAWRGVDTMYAPAGGLTLPDQGCCTDEVRNRTKFNVPNGDQVLSMLRTNFTLEWTMEFPKSGDQYIFFQPSSGAGTTELICALGQNDQFNCDINGNNVGWYVNPGIAYGAPHDWTLTYDVTNQKITMYLDGSPLPTGSRTVVQDWSNKAVTTSDFAFLGSNKTVRNVRLWRIALSAAQVARERAKGPCSVGAPIQFNTVGTQGWPGTGQTAYPTQFYPGYDVEPGYTVFGQPPPAQGARGPGGFNFDGIVGDNVPSVDITTKRAFRVEHVSSYHDANDAIYHPNLTMVGQISLPGQTALNASGYRDLYRAPAPPTGHSVVGEVAVPVQLLPGNYKFRWQHENGPFGNIGQPSGSTQISYHWLYMIGTRLE